MIYSGLNSEVSREFKRSRYLVFVDVFEDKTIKEHPVEVERYETPASVVRRVGGDIVICDEIDDFSMAYLAVVGTEVIQGFKGRIEEALNKYLSRNLESRLQNLSKEFKMV